MSPSGDGWGEATSVDDGSLMPSLGVDAAHEVAHAPGRRGGEEITMRANTDSLVSRPGTLDEPTVDRVSQPIRVSARRLPLPSQPAPDPRVGKLVVVSGNDNGREFELQGTPISVGRGLDNNVVLTDIAVSRKHLSIEFDGRQYELVDHGSGNGSMINDRLETGRCLLRHGDRLELGNTVFRFEHPATSEAVGTVPPEDEFDEGLPTAVARAGSKKKIPSVPLQPPGGVAVAPGRRRKPLTLPPPKQPVSLPPPGNHLPRLANMESADARLPDARLPAPREPVVDPAPPGPLGTLITAMPASPLEQPGRAQREYADESMDQMPAMMAPIGQAPGLPGLPAQPGMGPMMGQPGMGPMMGQPGMGQMTDRLGMLPNPAMPGYEDLELYSIKPNNRKVVIGLLLASVLVLAAAIAVMLVRAESKNAKRTAGRGAQQEKLADPATRKLPATVWGTDETVLVASIGKTIVPAGPTADKGAGTSEDAAAAEKAAAEKAAAEKAAAEKAAAEKEAAEKEAAEQAAAEKAAAEKAAAEKAAAEQAAAEKAAAEKAAAEKAAADKAAAEKAGKTTVRKRATTTTKTTDPSAARNTAAGQYRAKDFTEAADTLRKAASSASAKQATSLRSTATSYEKVGTLIESGNAKQTRDPVAALSAYDQAYQLDKKVGDGAHSSFLSSKLSVVAPKAAASHMAQGRYEAAKLAADKAAAHGAGSNAMVKRVRQGLETKAEEFYKDALRNKTKDTAEAKKSLQRIMNMVPASSPSYQKAAKLLSKLG